LKNFLKVADGIDVAAMEVGDFMKANALTHSPREKIMLLEHELLKHEQIELDTTHTLCDGLYARQIVIPAGTVLTGKIHLREHLNFIMKGEIAIFIWHGEQRIMAPALIVSPAGDQAWRLCRRRHDLVHRACNAFYRCGCCRAGARHQ